MARLYDARLKLKQSLAAWKLAKCDFINRSKLKAWRSLAGIRFPATFEKQSREYIAMRYIWPFDGDRDSEARTG